jgi:prokaryotic ubiquitin-like protein Pup
MAQRIHKQRVQHNDEQSEQNIQSPRVPVIDYEALLDEIDEVLQGNAEDYVRGFVQKGGQ